MQFQLQFQTPLLPVELLHRRRVSVEALGGDVAGPDVQLLPLQVDTATCGGSRIGEQSARLVHPRNRRLLLRRLPTGEREGPVEVAPATGGSRLVVRSPSAERTAGLLSDVVSQIGLYRGDECPLVRVLHVTARLGSEIVRAALRLFAQLDVAGASGALGEALIFVEEQIRHVDVRRVPRVHHRRRRGRDTGVEVASRIVVVVVVVINVRGGGGASGSADGGGGGDDVPRPWRWRRCLSKLSRPQSRTVWIGATGRRGTARTGSARRRRTATSGGWARLTTRGPAVVDARAQPRAARRRAGAEVAGQPGDRVENLRKAASRRRAAYLVHRSSDVFFCTSTPLLRHFLPAAYFCFLSLRGPRCIGQFALVFLPFSNYLPARDRLGIDARGAGVAHPRHFVTSHARTVIVDRDFGLELALRSVK